VCLICPEDQPNVFVGDDDLYAGGLQVWVIYVTHPIRWHFIFFFVGMHGIMLLEVRAHIHTSH
jgi:hypothetical protein